MKESRLFLILYTLLEKGRTTAPALAEKLGVSVRTIYRDMDALSAAGIPIYAEAGRKGGISILEHFTLDKALFSENEKREILASLQSLSAIGMPYESAALSKLSTLFQQQQEDWFEVDFSRWGKSEQDKFRQLKTAILHHHPIEITYVSASGKEVDRKIHPITLCYRSKEWYLKAYCTLRNDFRMFKCNRMLTITLLEEDFIPRPFPETETMQVEEYQEIVLSFPKEMAYRVYDEFEVSQIQKQENGDLITTAKMPQDSWLVGYLLSFGTQVTVIKPQYLQGILAQEGKKLYEKYKP